MGAVVVSSRDDDDAFCVLCVGVVALLSLVGGSLSPGVGAL